MDDQYDVTFTKATAATPTQIEVRYANQVGLPIAVPMAKEAKATKTKPRRWLCPAPDAPAIITWATKVGYQVDPEVTRYADTLWADELHAMAISSAATLDPDLRPTITGMTSTLLPHQWVAVHAAATCWTRQPNTTRQHRALLIADEPGLGKSLIALAALATEDNRPTRTVIVCPSDLTANWVAEIGQHFQDGVFRPWIAEGQTPTPVPDDTNVVVIGWAILSFWSDALIEWDPDALVVDEGHFAKSGKVRTTSTREYARDADGTIRRDSAGNAIYENVTKKVGGSTRAHAGIQIGAHVAARGGLNLALTGTPIVNRPVELVALLELIGGLAPFGSAAMFKDRFCDPQQVSRGRGQRPVTSYEGASNLLELNTRLRASGHYVRRTKEILVRGGVLKPKYVNGVDFYDRVTPRRPWMLEVTDEEMEPYWAEEAEQSGYFAEVALALSKELRSGVGSQKVQDKVRAEGARSLSRIAALRKAAAMVKTPAIVARVRELNAQGEKVVIAAHHRDVVDAYADAFSGLKIQGGMGVKKIEAAKAAFNERPVEEHPVLVLSVEAGKTGHTLCKQEQYGVGPSCAWMFAAEQVWVPGDEAQLQDRNWRIGQSRPVHYHDVLLPGTVDEQVYGTRMKKWQVLYEAVDAVSVKGLRQVRADRAQADREGAGLVALSLAMRGLQAGGQAPPPRRGPGA